MYTVPCFSQGHRKACYCTHPYCSQAVTKLLVNTEVAGILQVEDGLSHTITSGFPLYMGLEPELPPFAQATSNVTFYVHSKVI